MKSPAKFWCAAIVGLLLLLVLGGWALHLHAKFSLSRMKARLVAVGEKLSVEENLPANVPDSENGAREFLEAMAMLSNFDSKVQPSAMSMLSPGRARCIWMESNAPTVEVTDVWPGLREHLRSNQLGMVKLRAALEKPRLQFTVAWGSGFSSLTLPHLVRLKSAVQRLSASALMNLRDGKHDDAWKDLRAAVAIPASSGEEPLIISELVRVAIISIAVSTTWEALQHPGWPEAQLAEMQRWWEAIPVAGAAARAMAMERAMLGEEYELCRTDPTRIRNFQLGLGGGAGGSTLDVIGEIGNKTLDDPSAGLQMFMTVFPRRWAWGLWNSYHDEAWALGEAEIGLVAARSLDTGAPYFEVQRTLQQSMRSTGEAPPQYLLSALGLYGTHETLLQKLALAETQRCIIITAIALRRHRLAHGTWPSKLEELVPCFQTSVIVDPMDGKPLRYRRSADGFPLLYSVGTDGADDGGNPVPAAGKENKYWMTGRDILWPQRGNSEEVTAYHQQLESKRPANRRGAGSR